MYKRLLIPLDGSERAEAILAHLTPFLARFNSELTVLVAVETPNVEQLDMFPKGAVDDMLAAAEGNAFDYAESVTNRLNQQGLQAHGTVRRGRPADVILDMAEEVDADLVAMSSHGYGGWKHLLHGSTAEQVLRASRAPVLVVKSYEHTEVESDPLRQLPLRPLRWRRILVPLDGSPDAENVLADAVELAKVQDSVIQLLRVGHFAPATGFYADTIPPLSDLKAEKAYLKEVANRYTSTGLQIDTEVTLGYPISAIVEYIKHNPVDLVAMTTHGRSGLSRWVLGSVAESLLRRVHVPVFLRRTQPVAKPDADLQDAVASGEVIFH
jgi:nucleotide-binding universal stress UspA family protein